MKKNNKLLATSFIIILGLSGCAGYKARSLNRLTPVASPYLKERSVSFAYRVFTKHDCKKYLDRDVLKRGYQPIHITITNNTNRHLCISTKSFSLPCVSAEEVAQKVHTSTAGRAAGYGVAGLFLWPLLIPAVVDGVGSSQANEQLDLDFDQKAICDQTLSPFSTINGLIFVPVEYFSDNFTFTFTDPENKQQFVLGTHKSKIQL